MPFRAVVHSDILFEAGDSALTLSAIVHEVKPHTNLSFEFNPRPRIWQDGMPFNLHTSNIEDKGGENNNKSSQQEADHKGKGKAKVTLSDKEVDDHPSDNALLPFQVRDSDHYDLMMIYCPCSSFPGPNRVCAC